MDRQTSGSAAKSKQQTPVPEGSSFVAFPGRTDAHPPQPRLDLSVRQIRLVDLPALLRPPHATPLGFPEFDQARFRMDRLAIAALPLIRGRGRCFVAIGGERIVGLLRIQSEQPDRRWQALSIGAAPGVFDSGPVFEELFRHATVAAGVRGVKRFYARAPMESEALAGAWRAGFMPYAQETVFAGIPTAGASGSLPLRVPGPTDTWAIHQLYTASVPKQVQYAEAFTSHRWDAVQRRRDMRSWVVDEGHHVVAFVSVHDRQRGRSIECYVHPERSSLLPALMDAVVSRMQTGDKRALPITVAVRGYQSEFEQPLIDRGFTPVVEQEVLVRYTTAPVRVPMTESVQFHQEAGERLPKRAPSYLYKPRRDRAVP